MENRILQNFLAKYGQKSLNALLMDFERGVSGQVTADRMGVSRERVRQWRDAMGVTVTMYQPNPDVAKVRFRS